MDKIIEEFKNNEEKIVKIILSDTNDEIKKIIIRPILVGDKKKWQIENFKGDQVFHKNVEFIELFDLNFSLYKQITIELEGETITFSKSKTQYKKKQSKNNLKLNVTTQNREKNYIFNEGDNIPALVDLGVFTKDNKIVASKHDKFKQINRFIEIIDDVYKNLKKDEITILDFGCGKSYLTFLIYFYFVKIKNIKAKIIGYDLKKDVVDNCNDISKKYGYDGLEFYVSDVKKDKLFNNNVDMIVTLHACDTATDFALDFAIKNNIKQIFSVPCCQHEINLSIKSGGDFDLLLKDGLIKERFSALLTDAVRVELLRQNGYSVDVIELVDLDNTPKNLMIRATKNSTKKINFDIKNIKEKYKFNQTLFNLLNDNKI